MGFLTDSIRALVPATKSAIAATVPTWDSGTPQHANWDYARGAREGYEASDLVYACIELRCDAAGEPPLTAYSGKGQNEKKIDEHPVLDLLEHPNPFYGRSRFWSTVVMHLDVGGNAYIEKVRSASGQVVELWLLRPDRVKVVPSSTKFIAGYQYTINGIPAAMLPAEDVIHLKTRNPLNDYYGLAPIAVAAGRVDLDVMSRRFQTAFYNNAGIPAGLLNIVRQMNNQEREDLRRRYRELYTGTDAWRLMVLDGGEASYTAMGLPPGTSGLAMPELNMITETRILGVYGVPPSLVPSMVGMQGNRGKTASESEYGHFWGSTMTPMFRDIDDALTHGLVDEFDGFDRIEHDLGKIKALQEDEDKRHMRIREDYKAGILTYREARSMLGQPEEPEEPGMVLVPTTIVPTWSDQLLEEQEVPEPVAPVALPAGQNAALPDGTPPAPVATSNGRANGTAH